MAGDGGADAQGILNNKFMLYGFCFEACIVVLISYAPPLNVSVSMRFPRAAGCTAVRTARLVQCAWLYSFFASTPQGTSHQCRSRLPLCPPPHTPAAVFDP